MAEDCEIDYGNRQYIPKVDHSFGTEDRSRAVALNISAGTVSIFKNSVRFRFFKPKNRCTVQFRFN